MKAHLSIEKDEKSLGPREVERVWLYARPGCAEAAGGALRPPLAGLYGSLYGAGRGGGTGPSELRARAVGQVGAYLGYP